MGSNAGTDLVAMSLVALGAILCLLLLNGFRKHRRALLPPDGIPIPEHVVQRFRDKHPDHAHMAGEIAVELQRWLKMTASIEGRLPMRGIVDEMWHLFVLDTKAYAAYCQTSFGRFIDHVPDGRFVQTAGGWNDFHDAYERAWHRPAPTRIWPPRETVSKPESKGAGAARTDSGGGGEVSAWTGLTIAATADGSCGGDGGGGSCGCGS
jgi:hypothetical protein